MLENFRDLIKIAVIKATAALGWSWIAVAVILLVLAAVFIPPLVCWYWPTADGLKSCDSTIRNFGLVSAAIIALPLAAWRSWMAERQVKTAQHSLLNERYQKGAEMLGSQVLTVRLGGIYALERLAAEHQIFITSKLCSFSVRSCAIRLLKRSGSILMLLCGPLVLAAMSKGT